MSPAGVVLAGGHSSRMGAQKAWLEWDGATLLRHAVDVLGRVTDRVVVVRAAGQRLPPVPAGVRVVDDGRPGRGPLQGMLSGLRALDDPGAVAFVCAVDMPFLDPRFAAAVLGALAPGADAAVPRLGGRPQPLAAAYRAHVADGIEGFLDAGRRRVGDWLGEITVAWLEAGDLPGGGASLANVNTPAELEAARQARREKATTVPAAPGSSSPSQASAVAPASEVTA